MRKGVDTSSKSGPAANRSSHGSSSTEEGVATSVGVVEDYAEIPEGEDEDYSSPTRDYEVNFHHIQIKFRQTYFFYI